MAIAIPSKNIFEKKNPKVKDNLIERVEVSAVDVVPNNEYEVAVYNGSHAVQNLTSEQDDDYQPKSVYISGSSYGVYLPYAKLVSSFFSIRFSFPIVENNKMIEKVLVGLNNEGTPNIHYSLIGNKITGKTTASVYANSKDDITLGEISLSETKVEENVRFSSDVLTTELEVKAEVELVGSSTATATTKDNSTISNKDVFEKNETEYTFDLTFLVGNESWTLKNEGGTYTSGFGLSFDKVYGTYTKYEPTQIEITIYGNTIGIDLTDKTIYINGETAKKVHSVDGNELMQTSNYYEEPVENDITLDIKRNLGAAGNGIALLATPSKELTIGTHLYYKGETALVAGGGNEGWDVQIMVADGGAFYRELGNIISCSTTVPITADSSIQRSFGMVQQHYQNGKETATLRCSIGEYYDSVSVTIGGELQSGETIDFYELFVNDGTALEIGSEWMFNGIKLIVAEFDSSYNYYTVLAQRGKLLAYMGKTGVAFGTLVVSAKDTALPMTFNLYDKVVPYVYAFVDEQCKDVPMSKYPDGRAKVFQVLSVRTFYDGAVWQEIEIQEI